MNGSKLWQLGVIAHQILDERLGNATIDTIHRHVVAVVGGPTECQLREVACAYHQCVAFVGKIHEYLCTLAGLRILIGGIVDGGIVTNILKMLSNGLGNGNLHL